MSDVAPVEATVRLHETVPSPLGPLVLAGSESGGLAGVFFEGHSHPPSEHLLGKHAPGSFTHVRTQLDEYFAGVRREFELVLEPVGEVFQRRVWKVLATIPWGETRTYGAVAAELGGHHLSRAVGAANGRNPLSIIVPCHRVVGASGRLTGYAGGLDRKRFLLELEEGTELRPDRLF